MLCPNLSCLFRQRPRLISRTLTCDAQLDRAGLDLPLLPPLFTPEPCTCMLQLQFVENVKCVYTIPKLTTQEKFHTHSVTFHLVNNIKMFITIKFDCTVSTLVRHTHDPPPLTITTTLPEYTQDFPHLTIKYREDRSSRLDMVLLPFVLSLRVITSRR